MQSFLKKAVENENRYFDNRIAEIHITNYMNVTNNTLLILKRMMKEHSKCYALFNERETTQQ